jgi:hypothetical protein
MDTFDAIRALIGPETFDTGGLLNPEQGAKFFDYTVDQTVVLKLCDTVQMTSPKKDLDERTIPTCVGKTL